MFRGYAGITTTLEEVAFSAPFWEFFFPREALAAVRDKLESGVQHELASGSQDDLASEAEDEHEDEGQKKPESSALEHTDLLLDMLRSQLGDFHHVAEDLAKNKVARYDFLWTLFPPGELVFSRLFHRDCILEVEKTEYYQEKRVKTYGLHCKFVNWDGEKFGWEESVIEIPEFSGTRPIQDLEAYPVTWRRAAEDVRSNLLERGRKFVSLSGWHHKAYRGIMMVPGGAFFGPENFGICMLPEKLPETLYAD